MSQPAFVTIGGDLLNGAILQRVEVRQRLNDHWFCEIECRDTLGYPIPGEDALGASCGLSITAEDGSNHIIFSGVIIDVALKQEVWGSYTALLRAASTSWLIDHSERNTYFATPSLNSIAQQLASRAGGVSTQLAEKTSPSEYIQYGETNWQFLLRLADDHNGWIRTGLGAPELRNTFDAPRPLLFRGELGLLEFFLDGELGPARVAAAQYDSATFSSHISPGEQKQPQFESAGQRMGDAVSGGSTSLDLLGFTPRSRSATCADMLERARSEAERSLGGGVLAGGTSRDQTVTAGGSIEVQNLGEASGVFNVLEVTHLWTPVGYVNHFIATPWKQWRAPHRPPPAVAPGTQVARVVANHDPLGRGRLQVSLFWQGNGPLLWAPMTSLHSGAGFGLTVMPEVGDEVLVGFLDADPERPVVLGSLWNSIHQPPREQYETAGESDGNLVKRIVTKSGIRVHLVDTPGQESLTLATPRSNRLVLTEKAADTGRPAIAFHTEGDIHLRAAGRMHRISATQSNHIGTAAPSLAGLSCAQKMEAAIRQAPLGKGVLDALGGAKGIAIALGAAAIIQAIPVAGEVEDVVAALALVGLAMSGAQIVSGLKELYQFQQVCCKQAKTSDDLKRAGGLFANAVGKIGVNALLAVLGVQALKGAKTETAASAASKVAADVGTKPNEAFFWSGRSVRPDGTYAGGDVNAANIARTRGGTTLESLISNRNINMPSFDKSNPTSVQAWEDISSEYAQGASGDVHVVLGNDLRPGNIWEGKEFGALTSNPNVNSITSIDPATGEERLIWQR